MALCKHFVIATLASVVVLCSCGNSDDDSRDAGDSTTGPTPDGGRHPEPAKTAAQEKQPAEEASKPSAQTGKAAARGGDLDAIPEEMRPTRMVDDLKGKLLVPDVEKKGVAVFTDVITVEPGQDVMFCTYTPVVTKALTYIHATRGVQSRYGHHAVMQFVTEPRDPTTHECAATSLEAQMGGGIIGGSGKEGTNVGLAAKIVSELPAGAQLVINHHWINTGDKPMEVQAEMITEPATGDPKELIVARPFLVQNTDFEIPAHDQREASVECAIEHDVHLISALGHEHEWGTHVKAERLGQDDDVLFDHAFDESLVLHPMVKSYPPDNPYQLKAGDKLKLTCQWNNNQDKPLSFPGEMCVFSGWQIGADKDAICNSGKWTK